MPNTIRSLQIGKGWLPEQGGNGLDRMFYSLCDHLPALDVEVSGLVAGSAQASAQSNGRVQAFAPDTTPLPLRLYRARQAACRLLDRDAIDVVACHFAIYGAPVLDRLTGVPTVIHFHGPWAAESAAEGESGVLTRIKALVERLVYRTGDRFIVLSEAFRDVLCAQYGVPAERVRIVPGGVDADRFDVDGSQEAARERLGWPTDRPIILSVRRLAQRMGLSNLVTAMESVVKQHPDALLLIAGKGPMREKLAARIQSMDLDDHVRLLGFVPDDDLPYAYRAANFSVVPTTEHEGFGLITIESMAAGTPVLVTPVGGLPETVRALSDALVLPSASPQAVQDGLTAALDGTLSLPNSEACKAHVRARFDWPVIAQQVRRVYEEVL